MRLQALFRTELRTFFLHMLIGTRAVLLWAVDFRLAERHRNGSVHVFVRVSLTSNLFASILQTHLIFRVSRISSEVAMLR